MNSFDSNSKSVDELQSYLKECQDEVTGLLEAVGWTPDHFVKQEDIVSCSFDKSHRMPRQCLVEHEEKCELLFFGYRTEDLDDVQTQMKISDNFPSDARIDIGSRIDLATIHQKIGWFVKNVTHQLGVNRDKDIMNRVLRDHHVENHSLFFAQDRLPLTQDEFSMQLTPAERAALYDFVIKKVKGQRPEEEQSDKLLSADLLEKVIQKESEDKDKPTSYIEYLKAQRDYKRRRQSYRAKNVHITKKSYTEIIREVILNQTELLAEFRQDDHSKDGSVKSGKTKSSHQHLTEDSDESYKPGRDKAKKKKKHKKHKSHKHKHKSYSRSNSRSRSRSESRA